MKFKVYPGDFIVEEVLKRGIIKDKGRYKIFKAKKENIETLYLKKFLEKTFGAKVSFAGLKDKKSVSYFYFSAKGDIPNYISFKNFSAEHIGYSDKELSGNDIEKNNFRIVLRNVKKEEKEKIFEILEQIKKNGFPNYFDSQRVSHEGRGFFFEYLLKGDFKNAIKTHLLSISPEGKRNIRRFKKMVKKYFDEPERILPYVPSDEEKEIILKLMKKKYKEIIRGIKRINLKIYFEKFSSFIWNKAVSKLLRKKKISKREGFGLRISNFFIFVPYKINEDLKEILTSSLFPVPGTEILPSYPEFEVLLKNELKKEGLSYPIKMPDFLSDLEIKGNLREIWVFPENLEYYFEDDKIYLSFSLPPGAYATLLLKILLRRLSLCSLG